MSRHTNARTVTTGGRPRSRSYTGRVSVQDTREEEATFDGERWFAHAQLCRRVFVPFRESVTSERCLLTSRHSLRMSSLIKRVSTSARYYYADRRARKDTVFGGGSPAASLSSAGIQSRGRRVLDLARSPRWIPTRHTLSVIRECSSRTWSFALSVATCV